MSKSPHRERDEHSLNQEGGSPCPEQKVEISLSRELDPALGLTLDQFPNGDNEVILSLEPDEPSDPELDDKIPLRCDLCPNGVTFSDTSHLLTHMNSKSHIFHHWNLELFKEVDPSIRAALQDFQEFWEKYNLAGRIRTRMIKRNQVPQIASDALASEQTGNVQADIDNPEPSKSAKNRRRSRKLIHTAAGTKTEHIDSPADTELDHNNVRHYPEASERPYDIYDHPGYPNGESGQPLMSWHQRPHFHLHQVVAGSPSAYYSPQQEELHIAGASDYFNMPAGRHGNLAARSVVGDNASELGIKYEESEDCRSFKSEDTTGQTTEKAQEEFRPKGLQFAGMGGFDAAGNDQKRKRNQRKDPDVLIQLEASSERVTKDEFVFDLHLNLQRTRQVDIESDISDDGGNHIAATKRPKRRASTAKATGSVTRPRTRPIKRQTSQNSDTKATERRAKRASARAAEAAITKLHQQRSVTSSVENSPLLSRPSSAHGAASNQPSTTVVKHETCASLHAAGPLAPSSSGLNSLRGASDQTMSGQSGLGGLNARVSSPWLSLRSTNQNMVMPVMYLDNKSTNAAPQPGKENDPNVLYGRGHYSSYLTATHDPSTSNAYNPLFVQHGLEGAQELESSYANPENPAAYPGPNSINQSGPFLSMHMQRLGRLDQENTQSNSGFNL